MAAGQETGTWTTLEVMLLVLFNALESSMAERLHDLARNSMNSVGVSGGTQDTADNSVGPFSSILSSSPLIQHFDLLELTATKIMTNRVKCCVTSN